MADPKEAPVGDGMVKRTVNVISLRKKYKEEALAAAVSGKPHPDFDDWKQSQVKGGGNG